MRRLMPLKPPTPRLYLELVGAKIRQEKEAARALYLITLSGCSGGGSAASGFPPRQQACAEQAHAQHNDARRLGNEATSRITTSP